MLGTNILLTLSDYSPSKLLLQITLLLSVSHILFYFVETVNEKFL